MGCLDDNTVVEFIQGLLSPEARARLEEHVDQCASCRKLLGEVAKMSFAGSSRRGRAAEVEALGSTLSPLATLRSGPPTTGNEELLLPEHVLAGRFRIIRCLGRGSFGAVYEVEDLQLQERVALKLLRPEVQNVPSLLKHLHHEIVVGRRISHPNVCRIFDLGTCGETNFITMALVRGQSLDAFLAGGVPDTEHAVAILLQIGSALAAAHGQGVVHRDLKPSNIMIDEAEQVTVMDFGLARDLRAGPSQSGLLIGSPAYWSPEQARGERATERSDIYTFGLIACDLFGARRPNFGEEKQLAGIPPSFKPFVERCLRPAPADRFATMRDLLRDLRAALRRSRAGWRRVLLPALAAAGALGLALGGVALYAHLAHQRRAVTLLPAPDAARPGEQPGDARALAGRADARQGETGALALREPDARPNVADPTLVRHGGRRVIRRIEGKALPARELDAGAPADLPRPAPVPRADPTLPWRQTLAQVEAERRRRGILLEDIPGYRVQLQQTKRALEARHADQARTDVSRLQESLRRLRIDGTFISRKLERLNRLRGSMRLDEGRKRTVAEIFAKVHDRYFSGDYAAANAHLNEILRLLGRGE